MERVIVYIDGFNLYHGIEAAGWSNYLWLDLCSLSRKFLKKDQCLVKVKYFTAEASDLSQRERQRIYWEALRTLSDLKIILGKFSRPRNKRCQNPECHKWLKCSYCEEKYKTPPTEKKTDVNIVTELIVDTLVDDNCDVAIIVSGDSDLTPAIKKVVSRQKQVTIAFPPERFLNDIANAGSLPWKNVECDHLKDSQFPDEVISEKKILKRPSEW